MSPPAPLVIVASPNCRPNDWTLVSELASNGARVIAWQHQNLVQDLYPSPNIARVLRERGIACESIEAVLGEVLNDRVEDNVVAWLKRFSKLPLDGSASFHQLFRYRHLSLWWWAELFLYHRTLLRLLVRDVEALAQILEKERPSRLVVVAPVRQLGVAASTLMPSAEVGAPAATADEPRRNATSEFVKAALKTFGAGVKALARRAPEPTPKGSRRVFFLTHASMWRERTDPQTGERALAEMYLDQILAATASGEDEVRVLAVGPPVPFKYLSLGKRLKDIVEWEDRELPYVPMRRYAGFALSAGSARAYVDCLQMWRVFRGLPNVESALSHHGVPLGELALASFRDTFLLQLPWAIRSYREVHAALEVERPDVMALYSEYSGLGRAAIAAADSLGIPSLAVQHGILYPRLFGIIHEEDEVRGENDRVPMPTRTAVFGTLARQLLVDRGKYDPGSIVVTGSPKFDALAKAGNNFDRAHTRERVDVAPDAVMAIVASRFTAIGPVFAELVRATEAIDGLWLLVKPHQAELADPYREIIEREGSTRVRMLPTKANLLELLYAADGLVTVDSFASSEALVLGRPVLVLNLPSNLSLLVDKKVALGVRRGESIEPRLREFMFDGASRERLEATRKQYMVEFASGADGRSTERIVQALHDTADISPR